jgi:carboxypeptidase family protein
MRLRAVGPQLSSTWVEADPGALRLIVAVEAAKPIAIAVLDAQKRPAAPAFVALSTVASSELVYRGFSRSDPRGNVNLGSFPGHIRIAAVFTSAAGLPVRLVTEARHLPTSITLPGGCALEGRLRDPEGRPLAGVTVRAEALVEEGVDIDVETRSDTSGRYAFPVLPRGKVALELRAPGRERRVNEIDLAGCSARWNADPTTLGPAAAVQLRVADAAGEPVRGATVSSRDGRRAETDASGVARLDEVNRAEALGLIVRAPGFLRKEVSLDPPLASTVSITLDAAAILTGSLVDARERPVENAVYEIRMGRHFEKDNVDATGLFEVEVTPDLPLQVVLRSPRTLPVEVAVESLAPGERRDLGRISAPEGLAITGRVVGADSGAPVPGARLRAPRARGAAEVVAWALGDYASTVTAADGRFSLTGIAPQPSAVRLEAPGFAPREVAFVPEPDATSHDLGDVPVSLGGTIEVHGDPEWRGSARADWQGQWRESDMISAPLVEGLAFLDHVPPGEARVTVVGAGKVLCESVVSVPERDSVVADCGESSLFVEGVVTSGHRPAGPGLLTWHVTAGNDSLILNRRTRLGLVQQQVFGAGRPQVDVAVDGAGRFATDELAGGGWTVLWHPDAGGPLQQEEISLPQSGRSFVALAFPAMRLGGYVRDPRGRPIGGARVVEMTGHSTTRSAEDGSFEVSAPAGAPAVLRAFQDSAASQTVVVQPGTPEAEQPIALVLDPDSDARVVVAVTADGSPVAGALVFVETNAGTFQILTTGTAGTVEVEADALNASSVRASALAAGRWARTPWRPVGTARSEGLAVALGPTGGMVVTIGAGAGVLDIEGSDGWLPSRLMRHAGLDTTVASDRPVLILGLPPGRYSVGCDGAVQQVLIEAAETTEVDLR